jgi:hypothetical protein
VKSTDGVHFAAGARRFLACRDDKVGCWELASLAPKPAPKRWIIGKVAGLFIGSESTQVAGVLYEPIEGAKLRCFDLRSLRSGRVVAIEGLSGAPTPDARIRASADGYAFCIFGQHKSLIEQRGGIMESVPLSSRVSRGSVVPGRDGRVAYFSDGVAVLRDFPKKPLAQWKGMQLVPTGLRGVALLVPPRKPGSTDGIRPRLRNIDIVDVLENRVLLAGVAELGEFDEAEKSVQYEDSYKDPITWDKRFRYSPYLGVLATLAMDNCTVTLRKIDMWKRLEESGAPYLYVVGRLPVHVRAGETLSRPIVVKSSSPKVRFELLSGPDGLRVDETGMLSWKPSASMRGKTVRVLVRFFNEQGIEKILQHEFAVH